MRTPRIAAPAVVTARRPEILADFEVTLTTRLFGGGAKAREIDEILWLRPPALKGALRHWWRAGHAHLFLTLAELKVREDELFGSAATFDRNGRIKGGQGLLSVQVKARGKRDFREGEELSAYSFGPSQPLTTAYFGARAQGHEGETDYREAAKLGLPGKISTAHIRLEFASSDVKAIEQVREALRLWLVLGGIGARTRRGAGAIAVSGPEKVKDLDLPTSIEALGSFLSLRCQPKDVSPDLAAVFCLCRTTGLFVGAKGAVRTLETGEKAQIELLKVLKAFRQDRKPGQAPRPGRSNWPEPNAIRLLYGPTWHHQPDPADANKFPRAALGLPIVMPLKPSGTYIEPPPSTVEATLDAGGKFPISRYASPVILRPVQVVTPSGPRFAPVAIVTSGTLPLDSRPLVKGPVRSFTIPYPIATSSKALVNLATAFGNSFNRLI